jgi:hypothetical protein
MKTAEEMRTMAFANNKMVKWCETILQEKIEKEAKGGGQWVRVVTDDIPGSEDYSRAGTVAYIKIYLKQYGYTVSSVNSDKNIDIQW